MKNIRNITILYTKWDKFAYTSHELLAKAARFLYGSGDYTTAERKGGKPYFAAHPEICFSISHSGEYWMCVFADREVGLDIQREEKHNKERLSRRFFQAEERKYLEETDYAEFYDVWAAKEAYLKFTGDGLAKGLTDACVVHDRTINTDRNCAVRLQKIEFCDMYKVWLCSAEPEKYTLKEMFF